MKVKHAIRAHFVSRGYSHRRATKLAKGPNATFLRCMRAFGLTEAGCDRVRVAVSDRIIGAIDWQRAPEGYAFWHQVYTLAALKEAAI